MKRALWKSLAGKGGKRWHRNLTWILGWDEGAGHVFKDESELIMFSDLRNIPKMYEIQDKEIN